MNKLRHKKIFISSDKCLFVRKFKETIQNHCTNTHYEYMRIYAFI